MRSAIAQNSTGSSHSTAGDLTQKNATIQARTHFLQSVGISNDLMAEAPLNLDARLSSQQGNLAVSLFCFLMLLLTLGAVAADQFAAPILYSSSPLWATSICTLLVWRKGHSVPGALNQVWRFSFVRFAFFVAAHISLVLVAVTLSKDAASQAGTISSAGWLIAALKLSVLLPTVFLQPLKRWRSLVRLYSAEFLAGVIVLFTFIPGRIITALWPWYGQLLGKSVFFVASLFVPGLTYAAAWTPTINGPHLDVTVLLACSGISGLELFDCLFAFVAFLDWNKLNKKRTLLAYFAGIFAILLTNVLRITSLVVLGNRGFTNAVEHFHISAGWLFFSAIFIVYLAVTYRWLLANPAAEHNSPAIPESRN
jgi:exosortase/archaeosortase family protein